MSARSSLTQSLRGLLVELAEMMVHIALQIYRKHITFDKKGTPVLSKARSDLTVSSGTPFHNYLLT
jgi:hypothetical protein